MNKKDELAEKANKIKKICKWEAIKGGEQEFVDACVDDRIRDSVINELTYMSAKYKSKPLNTAYQEHNLRNSLLEMYRTSATLEEKQWLLHIMNHFELIGRRREAKN